MSKIFAVPASKTLIGACTLVGALLAANVCSSVEHVGKSISRNSNANASRLTPTTYSVACFETRGKPRLAYC